VTLKPYEIYDMPTPAVPLARGELALLIHSMRVGQCVALTGLDEANAANVIIRQSGFVPMQRSVDGVVLVWKLAKQKKEVE
jgi:hypothetical protein